MEKESNESKVMEQFGREAENYKYSRIHSNQEDLDFIVDFVRPKNDWKVLDVATGAGHCALAFADHVSEVLATDITEQMLEKVEELKIEKEIENVETAIENVHQLSFDDNGFDLVTIRIAPHHFHSIQQAIAEVYRVTKPGGFIFIEDTKAPEDVAASEWFNTLEKLRDESHVKDLSAREWIKLLESTGAKVVKTIEREKEWPLKWWTERMSTPPNKVKTIVTMIENEYDTYRDHVKIEINSDGITIFPKNIYLLAKK